MVAEPTVSSSLSRHTTPEKLYIEACDEGADAVLAIDRLSNEMTFTGRHEECKVVIYVVYCFYKKRQKKPDESRQSCYGWNYLKSIHRLINVYHFESRCWTHKCTHTNV